MGAGLICCGVGSRGTGMSSFEFADARSAKVKRRPPALSLLRWTGGGQPTSNLPTVMPSAQPTKLPSKQPSNLPTFMPVVPATSCPAGTFDSPPGCCVSYEKECGQCVTGLSCYSSVCACALAAFPAACTQSVVTCAA